MFTVVIYCLWAVFGHFKLNIYSNFFRSLATTTEKMGNMRTGDEIVNPCIATRKDISFNCQFVFKWSFDKFLNCVFPLS